MKITILLPVYNSIKYLERSVTSALNQDYDNYDIHIYDNGSTDGSLERARSLEVEHERITVHEVPNIYKNSFREAVDHAFQNVDTDYITFLCSDDYIEPQYLSNCMRIIAHDPEKIRCVQSALISDKSDIAPEFHAGLPDIITHTYKSLEEFKALCLEKSPVTSPSVIYNKNLYPLMNWSPHGGEAHRHSDIQEAGAGDYDTFCGFAHQGVFIYPVPVCLGYHYCWHPNQCTWGVHQENYNYDKMIQNYWKNKWTS